MTVLPSQRLEWPDDFKPKRRKPMPQEEAEKLTYAVLVAYAFDEAAHPRIASGHEGGGRFRTKAQIAALLRAATKGGGTRQVAEPPKHRREVEAVIGKGKQRVRIKGEAAGTIDRLKDKVDEAKLKKDRAEWKRLAAQGTIISEVDEMRNTAARFRAQSEWDDIQEGAKSLGEDLSYVLGQPWVAHALSWSEGLNHVLGLGMAAPGAIAALNPDIRFVGEERVVSEVQAVHWKRVIAGSEKPKGPAEHMALALDNLLRVKDPDKGALETIDPKRLKRDLKRLGTPGDLIAKVDQLNLVESRHERQARSEHCKEVLGVAPDTVALFKSPETGKWDPERVKLHDQIIDTLLRERNADGSPNPKGAYIKPPASGKKQVLFTAGGNAVGKSTVLGFEENSDIEPPDNVHIDFDEVKKFLPEFKYLSEKKDPYATDAAHFESAAIAKRLKREAVARGLNVLVDASGDSSTDEYQRQLMQFKKDGYEVKVVMVDAPFPIALDSMVKRGEATGRFIPLPIMWRIHRNAISHHLQWRESPAVDEFKVYYRHGSGGGGESDYALIESGGKGQYEILDKGYFEKMKEKALHGVSEPDIGHID